MKTSRAAIRYAKALILESVENNNLEKMFNDMQTVWQTFEENPDLEAENRGPKMKKTTFSKIIPERSLNTLRTLLRPEMI